MDKIDYWNEAIRRICGGFTTEFGDTRRFNAQIALGEVAGLGAASICSNSLGASKDRTAADQSAAGYFFLILQQSGCALMAQGDREAKLRPMDLTVIDGRRACSFRFAGPISQLSLHIPESIGIDLFGERAPFAMRLDGSVGIGHVLAHFLETAHRQSPHLNEMQTDSVRNSLLSLVGEALNTIGTDRTGEQTCGRYQRFVKLREHIRACLADPELDLDQIGRANGMSRRQVFRLFEENGLSPWRWITRHRLDGARLDLCDPSKTHESVTQIAFRWGFKDSAHFSKAYKAQFGIPPSVTRERAANQAHFDKPSAPGDKNNYATTTSLGCKRRNARKSSGYQQLPDNKYLGRI